MNTESTIIFPFRPIIGSLLLALGCFAAPSDEARAEVTDSSPLQQKAAYLQQDLLDKHWLDGLYIGIVPAAPPGVKIPHTVDQPGNVIHAGVWTGRYLAGVGYQYAVTKDPQVRKMGQADSARPPHPAGSHRTTRSFGAGLCERPWPGRGMGTRRAGFNSLASGAGGLCGLPLVRGRERG